jgi:IPT/TIG domain
MLYCSLLLNLKQRAMAIIETDANGNEKYIKDPDGNEIGRPGKRIAGILLVVVTALAMVGIIAHWPDKLPPVNQAAETKYYYKWFAVTYAGKDGVPTENDVINTGKNFRLSKADSIAKAQADSIAKAQADSIANLPDSLKPSQATSSNADSGSGKKEGATVQALGNPCSTKCTIDLNTLILLLVSLAGFLGNMIHIAASFTNFVGAGKFKRSWILWYCVKPFTAAALAVGVYIIFRAGFLNSGEAVASVNLYGVVALAVLAGLYTDMATQKLKEVFAVVFQSSSSRPDPLTYPPVKISDALPNPFPLNTPTQLVVTGEGFANRKFTVKINDVEIKDVVIKTNALVFNYEATAEKPILVLYDEKNAEVLKYTIITQSAAAPQPPAAPTVTSIAPATATVNTATPVTITGTGLTAAGITVNITSTTDATDTTAISDANLTKTDTTITFTYTPIKAGTYNIAVASSDGTTLNNQDIVVA